MSKIHPTENKYHQVTEKESGVDSFPSALTVWKRSSMSFQGTDGFTVFNREGRLAFRVDNYSRNPCLRGGLVLMDGDGKALLTLKPSILSMKCQWNGYKGDGGRGSSPLFSIRRQSMLVGSNDGAQVFMRGPTRKAPAPDFRIEGCFIRRNCKIRGPTGKVVAEISRKKANSTVFLSDDVFNLVVETEFDCELIMAFVVIMDRICRKPYTPVLCS